MILFPSHCVSLMESRLNVKSPGMLIVLEGPREVTQTLGLALDSRELACGLGRLGASYRSVHIMRSAVSRSGSIWTQECFKKVSDPLIWSVVPPPPRHPHLVSVQRRK